LSCRINRTLAPATSSRVWTRSEKRYASSVRPYADDCRRGCGRRNPSTETTSDNNNNNNIVMRCIMCTPKSVCVSESHDTRMSDVRPDRNFVTRSFDFYTDISAKPTHILCIYDTRRLYSDECCIILIVTFDSGPDNTHRISSSSYTVNHASGS